MKRIIKFIGVLTSILLLSGCLNKDSMEDIDIYTSLYPIEYIANSLYGDYSNIVSMYPKDVNPYTYKLTNKQINNFSKSDLVIYNGLDVEKDYIVKMLNRNKRLKIIDSTAKIEYSNEMDEIWINPSNMITIAQNIRNGLKEYINSSYLQNIIDKNYEELKLKLSTIDATLKETVANAKTTTIVVADDDLKIFEKYGLDIISLDEDSITDKAIVDTKNLLNNDDINYIFVKKGYTETQTLKDLKDSYGAKFIEIDTLNSISTEDQNDNKDYITIMYQNIDNLKEELY